MRNHKIFQSSRIHVKNSKKNVHLYFLSISENYIPIHLKNQKLFKKLVILNYRNSKIMKN